MKIARVDAVHLFPGSKTAEIHYTTDNGEALEKLRVWEAVFLDAVARMGPCSYVELAYDGQGVCNFDSKTKTLNCSKGKSVEKH